MKLGDLVRATRSVTGGGRVRRAVHADEIGVLVKTHYINDLSVTVRLWCDVLMADGVVTVPDWCLEVAHETETR